MTTNIFLSFLGISVSTSLIIAALILLTSILNKRYAAKWKYLIWIFLALRLLIPFSGTNGQSMFDMLSQMKTRTASESEEKHADTPVDTAASPRRVIVEIPAQMTAPIAVQPEKSNISITLLDIIASVWMIGCLTFLSMHLFSYVHYKRQVRQKGTIIKDTRILCQIFKLKRELHIKRTIQTIEYPEAASPMIIGFFNPILVLPKEQYSAEELFFILKHELVHLKRGDVYFKLLFVAANAIHWFNPFIWMMQKEAAIDMELSCDEKVVQGANYTVRKAYTETLLSMLHKRCAKRTVLSTQFYGGKNIMKKRFKNILIRKGKKNGLSILLCAVIMTINFGTLVGCSVAKEEARDTSSQSANGETGKASDLSANDETGKASDLSANGETGNISDLSANGETEKASGQSENDNAPSIEVPENTMTFMFSKEGETEQKQATLMIGDGYSIYLPDNEWRQSDSDIWTAVVNEQVSLWVTRFESATFQEIEEELADNGYRIEDNEMMKQEGNMIYKVKLNESEGDIWGVQYCYPVEAEDGWGRELPAIADTFAVSA